MNNKDDNQDQMKDNPSVKDQEDELHSRIRTEERGEALLPLAENEISQICNDVYAPDSVEPVAVAIYRRTLKHDIIQNRTLAEITSAAVYAACRVNSSPITLVEIVQVYPINKKRLSRTHSEISHELGLNTGPSDPKDFLPRFCSELVLSDEVEAKAREILEATMEIGLHSGKSPSGFAAASIYMASLLCNEKKTQFEVADATRTNASTIRDRYQEQYQALREMEDFDFS